jgi:hypothetical protein
LSLKGRNNLKGLNIDTEIIQKQMAQEKAGHFIIWSLDSINEKLDLTVHVIGSYQGRRALDIT